MQDRPKKRGDCENGIRPCPYVLCRHHLAIDINNRHGQIIENATGITGEDPHDVLLEMDYTCSLDVVENEDPLTLEEVGKILGMTREGVRMVEIGAMKKLSESAKIKSVADEIGIDTEVKPLTQDKFGNLRLNPKTSRDDGIAGKSRKGKKKKKAKQKETPLTSRREESLRLTQIIENLQKLVGSYVPTKNIDPSEVDLLELENDIRRKNGDRASKKIKEKKPVWLVRQCPTITEYRARGVIGRLSHTRILSLDRKIEE